MIVRYRARFNYGPAITARQRAYVRAAWGLRSVRDIGRRAGLQPDRVKAVAAYLGLAKPVPLPHLAEAPVVDVPSVTRRRCQACEALMPSRRCRCGWEAMV